MRLLQELLHISAKHIYMLGKAIPIRRLQIALDIGHDVIVCLGKARMHGWWLRAENLRLHLLKGLWDEEREGL